MLFRSQALVVEVPISPYLASATLMPEDLAPILAELTTMMAASQLKAVIDPVVVVADPSLTEPGVEFDDATTIALVEQGSIDRINLFFVDGFSGHQGSSYLAVSGGLPGPVGEQNGHNGILINVQATREGPTSFWHQTTAEFSFHEMGHYIGLYHTTEQNFSAHDVLDDTQACDASAHDVNENGLAEADECPDGLNLMFAEIDLLNAKEALTPDQKYIFFNSILARPIQTGGE